jgi:hypothetical protein
VKCTDRQPDREARFCPYFVLGCAHTMRKRRGARNTHFCLALMKVDAYTVNIFMF